MEKKCVLSTHAVANNTDAVLITNDTKLYVPVVTL